MRKSIVLSTRTDIIVVAKLAQFYEQQMSTGRPHTKSALIDMCLQSLLEIIKKNKMLKEDDVKIETETQAYKYLKMLGYELRNKDLRLPKELFKAMETESIGSTDKQIDIIKSSLKKVEEDLK